MNLMSHNSLNFKMINNLAMFGIGLSKTNTYEDAFTYLHFQFQVKRIHL